MQEAPQSAQAMADRGRGEIEPLRRARHVAFLDHCAEQHEEAEIDAKELSCVQHGPEFLSLAS